jgi:hypothetical protein
LKPRACPHQQLVDVSLQVVEGNALPARLARRVRRPRRANGNCLPLLNCTLQLRHLGLPRAVCTFRAAGNPLHSTQRLRQPRLLGRLQLTLSSILLLQRVNRRRRPHLLCRSIRLLLL